MDEIVELASKLDFLREDPLASKVCGHRPGSKQDFAKKVKLDRKTLDAGCLTNRLSEHSQANIARACRFDPNATEWRTGSVREFKDAYYDWHREAPPLISQRVGSPWAFDERLVSVTLFANQEGGGVNQPLMIELSGRPTDFKPRKNVRYAVERGELSIECVGCETSNIQHRAECLRTEGLSRNPRGLKVDVFGSHLHPGWFVESLTARDEETWWIHGEICQLRLLQVGSTVKAQFKTYVKDLEDKGAPSVEWSGRGLTFNGEKISAAKKRLLALLEFEKCCDRDGRALLAEDTLQFMPRSIAVVGHGTENG